MAEQSNRVKYAYLDYGDIQNRIDNGDIDEYDIVFTKDTHEQYLIKDDLSLLNIKSRIYRFGSIVSAKQALNSNTDTYEGQIVAIADNDLGVYHGFIVNKTDNEFTVTSLADSGSQPDYDSLAHRPITNKVGTLANPLIIGDLDSGMYNVSGEYKIFNEHPTIFSSSMNHLFLVEKTTDKTYVKDVSASETTTYVLSDEGKVDKVEGVTNDYLDEKIESLNLVSKDDLSDYMEEFTTEYLDQNLDVKIEGKVTGNINSLIAEDSDIEDLFK